MGQNPSREAPANSPIGPPPATRPGPRASADFEPLSRVSRDSKDSRDSKEAARQPGRSRSRSAGAAPPPVQLTRLDDTPRDSAPSPSDPALRTRARPPDAVWSPDSPKLSALSLEDRERTAPLDIPSARARIGEDDRPYRNSARIVHGYGPKGMAPLVTSKETAKRNVIPIIITWSGGGKQVYVTGSFNSWKQKVRLNRSDDDFTTILDLPPGTHHFKFIVDGEWRCSDDLPARADDDGNLVNYLEVYDERGRNMNDGLDDVGDQSPGGTPDSASPLSTTPSEQYTNHIPTFYLPVPPPDPPPPLPPQLESVVLNKPPPKDNEVDALNVPNHVALNHLYACSIRDGVMAVAGTTRYRRKYVTHILYKALTSPNESGGAEAPGRQDPNT